MTSDQLHLRIRRGLHQAAPFISGGDVLRHLHGWREEIYKTPLGLSWLRRGGSYAYQTTSGHGASMEPSTFSRATSALRRGVTICLVRSGPTITSTLLALRLGLQTRRLGLHS